MTIFCCILEKLTLLKAVNIKKKTKNDDVQMHLFDLQLSHIRFYLMLKKTF